MNKFTWGTEAEMGFYPKCSHVGIIQGGLSESMREVQELENVECEFNVEQIKGLHGPYTVNNTVCN